MSTIIQTALIQESLRSAALSEGMAEGVADDVARYDDKFVADDSGQVTHRETGQSPHDWLKGMAQSKPHWFPEKKDEAIPAENPWKEGNITAQGQFMLTHGVAKSRAMALAAGFKPKDFPRLGLNDETRSKVQVYAPGHFDRVGLFDAFSKENAAKFEANVPTHKPPTPSPQPGLNHAGYMAKKRAAADRPFAALRDALIARQKK